MHQYVLGLYEKSMPDELSIREKLEETGAGGFDFLELSIDETDRKLSRLFWSPQERRTIQRAMWETGVPIRSICLSGHRKYPLGHPEAAVRSRSLAIMESAIGLACDLGVRIIQLAGYDIYYGESTAQTRGYFDENLRKCVDMAAREGVILAFETMETVFMNTVAKAMDWVTKVNSPYLQVYPDAGNITNAALSRGLSVTEDLRSGRGHIAALHLKETRPGVFREVPYGLGHVDFKAVTACAMDLGVRRYLAEFWYDGTDTWRDTLRGNASFLRHYLDGEADIGCWKN